MVVPPQIPSTWLVSSANDRQCRVTGQEAQIALARSVPMTSPSSGKNRLGSVSPQAAWSRHDRAP